MNNLYRSKDNGDGTVLNLSPFCNRRLTAVGRSIVDSAGYFLCEAKARDPESVRIIARVDSGDQAFELRAFLGLK